MGAFNPIVEKTETTETHETDNVILRVTGLVKDFPGVRALDNVSFSLRRGEIHGLVGENGAGKTTLLKILSGVYAADNGEIELEGSKVHLKNPIDAQSKGICMEYQEKTLFPKLKRCRKYLCRQFRFVFWQPFNGFLEKNPHNRK